LLRAQLISITSKIAGTRPVGSIAVAPLRATAIALPGNARYHAVAALRGEQCQFQPNTSPRRNQGQAVGCSSCQPRPDIRWNSHDDTALAPHLDKETDASTAHETSRVISKVTLLSPINRGR